MAFENLFVRTKRSIGGVELDTILVEEHDSSALITKNPVEAGVDVTDHVIKQPDVLFVRGAVTDTPLGTAAFGQLIDDISGFFGTSTAENVTRSKNAYDLLRSLIDVRLPLEISTGLKQYSNMVITSLKVSQDKDTSRIMIADMIFEEIITTESEIVSLTESDVADSVKKNITPNSDRGRQEPVTVEDNTSILFDLLN